MEAVPDKGAENEGVFERPPPASVISREVVKTLKHDFGRGPTKARTYLHNDCVLVLLQEGHTTSERTMAKSGQQRAVAQGRVDISESIRASLVAIVERTLGRRVFGFMSSSQQDPDLISYVFVCEESLLFTGPEDEGED
jgi:uncharacterized protein YbcI